MITGKVVLVTGSAKGIGRHAARTFAKASARLAIADVGPLEEASEELRQLGAEVLPLHVDVRDESQVKGMIDSVIQQFGRIDVLVNNAGIVPHFAWGIPRWPRVAEMESSFWDRVLDTNLGGTFLCTKYALPHMETQGSGHVISMHGGGSGDGACPYVVSKDAIKSFTKMVAEEERRHGVCVVAVSPGGAIATDDAPAEAKGRLPGPESLQDVFVQAAQVAMELSGKALRLVDGQLTVIG